MLKSTASSAGNCVVSRVVPSEPCIPWCKFCAACAVQIAMHASSFIRPNVILAVLRAKCAVDPTRVRGVYRMTWLPQWCCCKNSGCLLACPIAPSAIKNYCTCCNDMNDGDKKYKFGDFLLLKEMEVFQLSRSSRTAHIFLWWRG